MQRFTELEGSVEKKFYSLIDSTDKNFLTIKLTIKQLVYFGIHVGHLKSSSKFMSSWIFYGWRNNVFIIDLVKTLIMTKIGLRMVGKVIKLSRSF